MPKKLVIIVTFCYTLSIAIFSLISSAKLPKLGTNWDDKIFLAFAYLLLVVLWYFAGHYLKFARPLLVATLFSIIYGIIIEVLQEQFTIARQLDVFDIFANCVGVLIATLGIVLKKLILKIYNLLHF